MPSLSSLRLSPKIVVTAAGVLALLLLSRDTFYQVQPEEFGLVTRLGRHVRTTAPGLHLKVPLLEKVFTVPVRRQLRQEFGFRSVEPGEGTLYDQRGLLDESIMLTADLNVAQVEWVVQYRISDPHLYLFRVRNPEKTLRAMTEAVVREVVGDRTVTEVLTVGRRAIEIAARERLEQLCEQYEIGLTIEEVALQDVNPPDPVKPSWNEVNRARQQRDRVIDEALGEYNRVIPRVRGEGQQTILQAEGYSIARINRAEGGGNRFAILHEAYRRAPEVTRRRMYLEPMKGVLASYGRKFFVEDGMNDILEPSPQDSFRSSTFLPAVRGEPE